MKLVSVFRGYESLKCSFDAMWLLLGRFSKCGKEDVYFSILVMSYMPISFVVSVCWSLKCVGASIAIFLIICPYFGCWGMPLFLFIRNLEFQWLSIDYAQMKVRSGWGILAVMPNNFNSWNVLVLISVIVIIA